MTPAVFLVILFLRMTSSSPAPDPILDGEWQKWKIKYGKTYSLGEEGQKRAVWEENMKKIKLHNGENSLGKHGFTMEMNAFGDMTRGEFRKMMIEIPIPTVKKGKSVKKRQSVNLPKFINWKKRGYVTPVRRQGICNSCWAMSATGAIEGQMFRKTGQLIPLSVQNLVDCSRPQGNRGCYVGSIYSALKYVKENGGLESEATYPYKEEEGPCRYNPENSTASIIDFERVPVSEDALMHAVATIGPISVAIDAWHESFLFYKRGIYYEPNCNNSTLNHAMLLVGYGFLGQESDGRKYWLVKNSLGIQWGNRGYMKLARDQGHHCGIGTYAFYPRV